MSRALKTGVLTSYKYDALGNLTRIADSKGTAKLGTWTWQVPFDSVPRHELLETPSFQASSGYTVDPLARITAEQHGNVAAFSLAETTAFAAANQLAQGALTTPTTYKLTARSSWSERAQAGTTTTFAINARDAYTSVGASAPSYDSAGATIGDGQSTYAYDAFGQLARVQASGLNRTYQRDALGRLIADRDMLAGGAVTRYAYDGLRQTFRKTPANAIDVTIDGAGLDDHLVTLLPGGKRRYLEQDRMGSVVMVTDELGAPIEYIRYSAFGEPAIFAPNGTARTTTAVDNRFGFQGHPHDWTTKLVDFRARHYRPTLGRFLTMDPLGLAGGTANTYAFVGSAPLSWIDPLGLRQQYVFSQEAIGSHIFAWERRGTDEHWYVRSTAGAVAARTGGAWREVTEDAFVAARFAALDVADRTPAQQERLDDATGGLNTIVTLYRFMPMSPGFNAARELADLATNGADPLSRGLPSTSGPRGRQSVGGGTPPTNQPPPPGQQPPQSGPPNPPSRDRWYIPRDQDGNVIPLPQQKVNDQDIPLPDARAQGAPHTVLGGKVSSEDGVTYRQSATFPGESWPKANGYDVPWSRVDWHDHGRPKAHTVPHQHEFLYDFIQKQWIGGDPTPVR